MTTAPTAVSQPAFFIFSINKIEGGEQVVLVKRRFMRCMLTAADCNSNVPFFASIHGSRLRKMHFYLLNFQDNFTNALFPSADVLMTTILFLTACSLRMAFLIEKFHQPLLLSQQFGSVLGVLI